MKRNCLFALFVVALLAGLSASAKASPAAILTANDLSLNPTFTPGTAITIHWSAIGADQFSSTLSIDGGPEQPWVANTAQGNKIIKTTANQIGHQYVYTYRATDSKTGLTAVSSVSPNIDAGQNATIVIHNDWDKAVTYASLFAYPADYSTTTHVGYWPNLADHQTFTQVTKVPTDFTLYFGSFYFYDATEFHNVTCQASFPKAPKRIRMVLNKNFTSCEILP